MAKKTKCLLEGGQNLQVGKWIIPTVPDLIGLFQICCVTAYNGDQDESNMYFVQRFDIFQEWGQKQILRPHE